MATVSGCRFFSRRALPSLATSRCPDDDVLAFAKLEFTSREHDETVAKESLAILVHVENRRVHALQHDCRLLKSMPGQDIPAPGGSRGHHVEVRAGVIEAGCREHRLLAKC